MFKLSRLRLRELTLPILWDLFMLLLAFVNMWLIVFDLTYLYLRPVYFRYLPVVTTVYDPVKGIEAHPVTEAMLEEASAVEQLLARDPASPGIDERLQKLRELTRRIVLENPFERSGQTGNLVVIKSVVADATGLFEASATREEVARAAQEFWSADRRQLSRNLRLFNERIEPLLALNYHRGYDLDGTLVDNFWKIDLPFLLVFAWEFFIRWALAIRRKTYPKWWFFPVFNWYDLLGIVPLRQFRFFRLFRVISIYIRLHKSDLTWVGQDPISRTVAYISGIIAEEISDLVAIRIMTEAQEEIRDGTHAKIFRSVVEPRLEEIEDVVVHQVREMISSERTQERLRALLRLSLDTAVKDTEAIRNLPVPSALLAPLVQYVGQVLMEATLQTATTTLETEEGQDAVREVVRSLLEGLFSGPGIDEVESLSEHVAVSILEEMKASVAVKKWTRPERKQLPETAGGAEDI